MLSRIMKICLLGVIAALIALFILSWHILDGNNNDLYLVTPKTAMEPGTDIKTVEKINDEKFMLTYLKKQQKKVAVRYANHDVSLAWTNYTFPFVCKYPMLNGGFFTKDDQEQKNNYAVLNERAAFDLFGSMDGSGFVFTLEDKEYIVKGVIKDNEENPTVYMPMMLSGENPNAFIAALDEKNGISVEYVQNELKQAGITDANYYFINLGLASGKIAGKAEVAIMIIFFYIHILLLILCIRSLKKQYRLLLSASKQYYFREMLKFSPKAASGIAGVAAAVFVLCVIFVSMLIRFLNLYLYWSGGGKLPKDASVYFSSFMTFQQLSVYVNSIFIVCIFLSTALFAYCCGWTQKSKINSYPIDDPI